MTNNTVDIILDAVLALKDSVDLLQSKKYIYSLIRPPGHHCHDKPNGFCIINNAIIAAKYAQSQGYDKILILDWDYHHFDGTEKFLNETICGVSIHAFGPCIFPGTGHSRFNKPYLKNIPLYIESEYDFFKYDDKYYLELFEDKVLPFILNHNPDLIIISNGLDAHRDDYIGGLNITNKFYINATKRLKELNKPLLYILEGGYNINVVKTVSLDICLELAI